MPNPNSLGNVISIEGNLPTNKKFKIEKINKVKTIEALLDNDQKSLTKIANANQQWLKTATARKCPECRSTEVRTDGVDYGICDSCDCSFSF